MELPPQSRFEQMYALIHSGTSGLRFANRGFACLMFLALVSGGRVVHQTTWLWRSISSSSSSSSSLSHSGFGGGSEQLLHLHARGSGQPGRTPSFQDLYHESPLLEKNPDFSRN